MLCDMPRVTPRVGFTLLELLVVLVLMGVAAALAAPAL
jgi:prepilin-type N-terminal cleavage/methylation domain-containing protein